jgi:hypothetical protein
MMIKTLWLIRGEDKKWTYTGTEIAEELDFGVLGTK